MRFFVLLSGAVLVAFGQTKNFDVYSYSIPSGYSEKTAPTFVELTRTDTQRGFACQFGLYQAQPAMASVEQELEAEWKLLVGSRLQLKGSATTQPIEAAGLPANIARSSAAAMGNISNLFVTVAVLRFPGRYLSVQFIARPPAGAEGCREDFLGLLRSLRMSATAAAPAPANPPAAAVQSRIPIGNTPGLYPGMPGWLPSGSGLQIPDPAIVGGKPVGLWWQVSGGSGSADVRIYLPNGVRASSPRLGGPRLYDLEAQRRQPGANGVGSFEVGGGQIVERYDGFENRYPYTAGRDSFQMGGATFRPVYPVTGNSIVGSWKGPGFNFDFQADGTLTYGTDAILNRGRYVVDGYLIQIIPERSAGWVELIGYTGVFLVRGTALMQRSR